MKQLSFFLHTQSHLAGFVARMALGIVMLPHGSQLLIGLFGGFGFTGSMNYFTQVEGLPWLVGFAVIMLQFFGAVLLLTGTAGRFIALCMIPLFIGMIATSHWQHGFFMNWMGNQKGEGFEFHILAIGLSLVVALYGSGAYSIDRFLLSRSREYSKNDNTGLDLPSWHAKEAFGINDAASPRVSKKEKV